jgi:hypothetical protein
LVYLIKFAQVLIENLDSFSGLKAEKLKLGRFAACRSSSGHTTATFFSNRLQSHIEPVQPDSDT